MLDDRKPQTRALDMAVLLLVHAPERCEQVGDVLLLDADARITDGIQHMELGTLALSALDGEGDGAVLGVFDGVVHDIDEDLLDAHLVAHQLRRQVRRDVHMECELLFLGADPEHPDQLREHVARMIGHRHELHLS